MTERTEFDVLKELDRFRLPPVGLGLCSVVMGMVGLAFFIVPILGMPISAVGIAAGLAGIIAAWCRQPVSLRLAVAGLLLSTASFLMIWSIDLAASGYFAPSSSRPKLEPIPRRPFIPPPAKAEG